VTEREEDREPPEEETPGEEGATLEGRLRRLERILGQLESDEVELERALALFEEGVSLVRDAEKELSDTQLRVEELLAGGRTVPLDEGDDEGEDGDA
jgi:exodeoxyribonuclease VII small subunit